jgi:anti-anti-sigma factor
LGELVAIFVHKSEDLQAITIQITESFRVGDHNDFIKAYESETGKNLSFTIDLTSAQYMDSAGLGMLLAMRENFGGEKASIRIVGCSDSLRSILRIARFDQLFDVA